MMPPHPAIWRPSRRAAPERATPPSSEAAAVREDLLDAIEDLAAHAAVLRDMQFCRWSMTDPDQIRVVEEALKVARAEVASATARYLEAVAELDQLKSVSSTTPKEGNSP